MFVRTAAPQDGRLENLTRQAGGYIQTIVEYLTNPDLWFDIMFIGIRVLIIWLAARVVNRIARAAVNRILTERERHPLRINPRRARTIGLLAENVVTYTVNFIAILLILSQFHFNLGPLLAGAGVLGLAIGFGAQSIVKDVITGFFIIFEDQFGVGDVIQTGTYKGTVESIGLRVTTIRAWTGEVFIIPNSQIQAVTNYSIFNANLIVDLSFPIEKGAEEVTKDLVEVLQALHEKSDSVVKEPTIQGIQAMGESSITMRVCIECRPATQSEVIRDLNRELEKRLKESDEEMPLLKAVNYSPGERG